MPTTPSLELFGHLGLRVRLSLAFLIGTALTSLALTFIAVNFSESSQLERREAVLTDSVVANARRLEQVTTTAGLQQTMGGLLASNPSFVGIDAATNEAIQISITPSLGVDELPAELVAAVLDGQPSAMRFAGPDGPLLAVGSRIESLDGAFFEISPLGDIESSSSRLMLRLLAVAGATTGLGFLAGSFATRRLLTPLTTMTTVVRRVAAGQLDTRVADGPWNHDPDLNPLIEAFNDMVSALQQRIDRDARFASDVSHELRSPLTTFQASLSVLQNARAEMPERARLALDLLSSDMDRFTQLVEDLLEISRFDAGAVRVEFDAVPIVATVEAAVGMWTTSSLPIKADRSLEDLVILCDKRRVVRVLANFVDNAAKYGDGATDIWIRRRLVPYELLPSGIEAVGSVNVTRAEPDERGMVDVVAIGVEDEGPGVPTDDRQTIFERFNRGSLGGSRGADLGVGLGLALAAEHARIQGGRLLVEDRADGRPGACFVIEIPLITPQTSESSEPDLSDVTSEHRAIEVDAP